MAEIASAFVSLLPSAKGFGSKLDGQITPEVNKSGSKAGKVFGGALKLGAVAALGGAAVAVGFLKGSLDEAREAQKVGAQTNAVIKSTGGAANVTAKQVGNLSTAISKKVGIDDEAIQSGANMLLTFTNIRNEAGKGNKVFDQTVRAATDMSAALGTDTKTAAMQLGKALNDPVKGVTKLQRSGVTFTDQQKSQITTLVKSGKTLKAQKIILGEVNKEFGGSAKAQATAGDKAKVAFGNLEEAVGTALLPVLDKALNLFTKFATFLTNNIGPALSTVSRFIAPFKAQLAGLFSSFSAGGGASSLVSTLQSIGGVILSNVLPVVRTMATTFTTVVLPTIIRLGAYLAANLLPIFRQVATIIGTQVVPIISRLAQFFYGTLVPAVYKIVNAVGTALKPVFDQLFKTIQGTVLPAVSRLLSKFREWQPTIQKVISVLVLIIGKVLVFAATILGKVLPVVIRFAGFFLKNTVGAIIAVITVLAKIIGVIIKVGTAFVNGIKSAAKFGDGVNKAVAKAIDFVKGIPGKVVSALGNVGGILLHAGESIIQGLIDGITRKIGALTSKLHAITNLIPKHKGPESKDKKLLKPAGQHIMDGLIKGLESREKALKAKLGNITSRIGDLKSAAADLASTISSKFSNDIFGGDLGNLQKVLGVDTANARAFSVALAAAAKKGLSGGLFRGLAESGNVALAQQFANATSGTISSLETAFNARAKAANAVGQQVSVKIYGQAINAQTAELRGIRADLKRVLAREHTIHVHDKSGDPKKTAKETSRRLKFAGAN